MKCLLFLCILLLACSHIRAEHSQRVSEGQTHFSKTGKTVNGDSQYSSLPEAAMQRPTEIALPPATDLENENKIAQECLEKVLSAQ